MWYVMELAKTPEDHLYRVIKLTDVEHIRGYMERMKNTYNVIGRSPEICVGFPIHGYSFRVSTSDKSDTIKLSYSVSLDEDLEYSFKKDEYPGGYMADIMLKCIYRIIKKERI